MKFGETLRSNLVPEWEAFYLDYATLKFVLKTLKKKKEGSLTSWIDTMGVLDSKIDMEELEANPHFFYNILVAQVEKIEKFYIVKLAEVKEDIDSLGNQIEALENVRGESKKKEISRGMIQKAAIQCYRVVMMLDNFCNLNAVALKKIVKKHDKVTGDRCADLWMAEAKERVFFSHTDLDRLKRVVEVFYARYFCEGNKYNARNRLKQRMHQEWNWILLKLGFQLGITFAFFLLLPFAVQGNSHNQYYEHTWSWESFIAIQPVFRLVLLPMIAVYMWALNLVVFRKYRINWVYICEFHPINSATVESLLDIGTCLSAFFSVSVVLYILQELHSIYIAIPSIWWPLLLIVFVFSWVFFPFDRMYRGSRWTFMQIFLSVAIAPVGLVRFIDFFVGDIMTSMVKTLFDFEYTFCYYVTGDWLVGSPTRCDRVNAVALPILSGLPLYWRLMQCLRRYRDTGMKTQLLNALKYLISLSVVLFSTLNGNLQGEHGWDSVRFAWLGCFIVATLYSYTWDIKMDWGLLQKGSKYPLLRNNTMLPVPFYYYAMVSNFFLRFFWAITISPLPPAIGINPNLLTLIAAVFEVFRRFTWSIIRFENEYINNVGQFRKTDWVPLPFDVSKPKRVQQYLEPKHTAAQDVANFESKRRGSFGSVFGSASEKSDWGGFVNKAQSEPDALRAFSVSVNTSEAETVEKPGDLDTGMSFHTLPPAEGESVVNMSLPHHIHMTGGYHQDSEEDQSDDETLSASSTPLNLRRARTRDRAGSLLQLGGSNLKQEAQSDIDNFIEPTSNIITDILTDTDVVLPTPRRQLKSRWFK